MKNLKISTSPHILSEFTTSKVMWGVIVALIPAVLASLYFFKAAAATLMIVCIISCAATEAVIRKLRGKNITISDGSAVVTGLLLAMVLPPKLPIWIAIVGSVISIGLGKEIFGGLGYNIFNPALIGRAFLMAAFPAHLTSWVNPQTIDAATRATPLGLMKFGGIGTGTMDLFLGNIAGSLGETSALALIVGGAYLIIRKYADWRIPLSYVLTTAVLGGIMHIIDPANPTVLFHILAGGLLLGAIFMATDPVTSPITKKGRWIFGIGCGVFTIVIRLWSGLPEGVMYAILLMNGITPLINRFTKPRRFGT